MYKYLYKNQLLYLFCFAPLYQSQCPARIGNRCGYALHINQIITISLDVLRYVWAQGGNIFFVNLGTFLRKLINNVTHIDDILQHDTVINQVSIFDRFFHFCVIIAGSYQYEVLSATPRNFDHTRLDF